MIFIVYYISISWKWLLLLISHNETWYLNRLNYSPCYLKAWSQPDFSRTHTVPVWTSRKVFSFRFFIYLFFYYRKLCWKAIFLLELFLTWFIWFFSAMVLILLCYEVYPSLIPLNKCAVDYSAARLTLNLLLKCGIL